ncbi:TadE/TadG family type IV pilus assembly protein [Sulfitobacter aestuariivivens]|uniref:Pilus assembly protein n=1 Tax=Sulfitobacter aestuariivivens TaxID=2766981 RepID=A0A927DBG5_9RHOB|nr:TadE/TadG family type IV pilus assembly protein [Sulfitobacter aestuariivivens]MBD3666211.1 pilus assembly protein [Sulfitobacter aestuariivivens]
MVKRRSRRGLIRNEDGIALVEALLVMPIVLLAITAMVEFGVAVFHWNQTVKAVQLGARHVSVSSPMMTRTAYETYMTDDYGTIGEGDATPATSRTISCGGGTTPCDPTSMDRLMTGGDGVCGRGSARVGVCDVAPWITSDNIVITYSRSGLGYVGRPFGAVSTITVELRDVGFGFILLDRLIPVLANYTLPPHRVSTTSEDLSSCKALC